MLFENPSTLDLPADYLLKYDIYLWGIVVIMGLIGSIIFSRRIKNSTIDVQKGLLLGLSIFFLLFSFTRIAFILAVLLPASGVEAEVYNFWTNLGYIFGLLGLVGFLYGIEKYIIHKTKFILTIFSIIVVCAGILSMLNILERETVMLFVYVIVLVDAGIVMILFLGLAIKSTGVVRTRTFFVFLGIFLLLAAIALDSQVALAITNNLYIAPIINIVGLIILTTVQFYK
jgi:hypothetical protein